jgi:hypothetical protein|tara:strand:- start:244 stop:492 length:249 start_codon:yes stop_codon:yes gene_type:complete
MKDKKAAKKLIKRAKEHPDWYTKQEAWYAKMIKNESKISNSNTRRRKDYGLRGESEQSKESKQSNRGWFIGLLHKARSLVGL